MPFQHTFCFRTKWKRQTAVGFELLTEASNLAAVQHLMRTNPYWGTYIAHMQQSPLHRPPPGVASSTSSGPTTTHQNPFQTSFLTSAASPPFRFFPPSNENQFPTVALSTLPVPVSGPATTSASSAVASASSVSSPPASSPSATGVNLQQTLSVQCR